MRYEDSSQAGAVSSQSDGQAPEARDDLDTLAAGAREPVTGNVISGEGTQFGAASSDLSADDAAVTAVSGAGGKDSSFAGGKLAVTGEYGKLSMDAEGNYSYLANKGAPENVRDTFNYTLADKQGNSDTASLTIEIGKTPVVIQANAQQVVVGPDGVVVLPAGVQLSDIAVVGRNLVVTLPDGSQMVIIDGAVFVPQLVLGTVEVPATNLAALLIDSEPRPAAGTPPPSGGGNFGLPPGPLDPGVPLGDLLPPTEMVYVPPEVRELFDILDREPEISIDPGNGVPVANAVDSVNEAGLPARNEGEPQGSGEEAAAGANGDPSEATTGTIIFNSPDVPNVITINGIVVTGVVGQVIPGDFGNLVLSSFGDGTIGYTYTLFDNTSGNNTHDDFEVVITDRDGDSDTATLVINIVDDVPTARPDTDSIAAGQFGPATGNVITDAAAGDVGDSDINAADTVGADNASVTQIASVNVPANVDNTFTAGNLVVNGQYGVLTIAADGSYSYVRNAGTPGGVNDVFNYTLTDGDGDTSTTTLTISIGDATPSTAPNPTALVDDDAVPLANGNPGGVGDDADAANLSGTLGASGGDGPLTFDLLLTGAPAGFTYVDGPGGSVLVQQGGTTVLTITINSATGAYTVTQNAPIDHPAGSDENNVAFTINYRVTDQDGDPADGTLNINVDDDTPTIGRADVSLPTLTVDETNLALNASGSVASVFQTSFGADGPGSVSYALAVVNGTDSGLVDVATGLPVLLYNIGGVVTGSTSATLAGVTSGNTVFTASINANTGVVTLDQVRALDHPSNPNPNDAVSPNATSIQAVATVTDGDGDPVSLAVNIGSSLVFLDDGPSVDISLSAAAEPVLLTQDTETDGTPTTQDSASASFAANFTVNVNNGADGPGTQSVSYVLGVAAPGADSGLNQGGADIFLHLIGGAVVGSTSASAAGVNAGNTVFSVTVDAAGSVTLTQFSQIDHPIAGDPSATGSPFADHILSLTDNLVTLTATANVTDGDGDPASDSQLLNIGANLQFADDGPDINAVLTGTLLKLDETDGVGVPGEVDPVGGNLGTITVAAASLFTVSNVNISADTPTTLGYALVLSADGVASGLLLSTTNAPIFLYNIGGVVTGSTSATLVGVNAGNTAFTVSVNAGTGAVTMTQFLAVEHANPASNDEDSSGLTPGVLGIQVTATDFDGDTDQASVDLGANIRFEDDGPTIDVSVNGQVEEPVLLTQDTETDGTPTTQDSASSAINFGGVFNLAFTTGSDGAATPTLSYALGVSVQGVDSGLNSSGADIFLYLIGGVVVGSTSATAGGVNAGNTVFNVTVSGTGVVTLTQFSQIDHPIAGDPSATGSPFADHILSLTDTMVTLTASSTITDNDGDPANDSATVNIGANLQFADDGPDVAAVLTGTLLKLDETDGVGVPGEVDPAGGNLGTITVAGATLVSVTQPNVSADTPTALAYSLVLSVDGVASGLLVSSNNAPIFLYNIGGTITGSTSANLAGVNAGNTAFTVSVNAGTGAVTMTQFLAIEHPTPGASHDEDSSGLAAGALSLRVTATDFDGDTDQASVDLGSVIRFEDDGPSATNDTDVIVGGVGPATGNVMTGVEVAVAEDGNATDGNADNVGSDTPGRISFIDHSNVAPGAVVPNGGSVAIAGDYGVLTIFSNGDYSYLRNPATPGGVNDVFTYTLTDADGDTVTATLTIGIDDNFPTAGDVNVQLDDETLAGGIAGGTGDVNPNLVNVSGNLPGSGGDPALTWDLLLTGAPAGFSYVDGPAGAVHVMQGATHVVTITIVPGTGAYTVTQVAPIDHPDGLNENNVQFTVNYRVTDADGDFADGTIDVDIDDDSPTVSANAAVQVDDDALAGGNPGGTGDVNPDTANLSGTLGHAFGADGGSIAYLTTGAPAGFVYEASGNNLLIKQGGVTVLTVTLNPATGAYTVVQNNPIDHAAGANENDVAFTINYRVTDGDNDTVDGTLTINADDDTPTVSANAAVQLDDDALAGGNPGGTGDVDPNTANLTGTLGHSFGADGAGSVAYLTTGAPGGFVYEASGNNLLIKQGGVTVITLTLNPATGAYTVTHNAPIVHAAGSNENDVAFTINYRVTDGDSDTVDGSIVINVDDDTPVAAIVTTGQGVSVDESAGVQLDSNDTTNAGVIALFAGVANVGVDPDMAAQYAQNASALVASTGSSVGADAPGTTVFSLNVSAAGVDSGLNTTAGADIFLFKEGDVIVGRVGNGAGPAAFALAINPSTGVVSMVEYLSIQHPNAANPDDSVSIANGALLATVTVTDADGDSASQSTPIGSLISFQDSGPIMTAAQNMNIQNSGDVAHTAAFAFNLGADGANTSNDVITNVTGSATVGGVPVTNWILTPGVENATTASYSFSFDYPIGGGNTASATGTLVFDKVAGTYTVDLANPIQGVTTILQTAQGTLFQGYEFGTSTPDGSQPAISVTQIQDLAGTANDIFVQFTSVTEPSSGTGDDNLEVTNWVPGSDNPPPVNAGGDTAWNAGQLFNQVDGWVSTSNSANGVDGDTIQGGEVLDFTLVQGANPTGNLAQPAAFAQASAMFLKFDGIGDGEDMIVILKLYDPNTNTYTTRAIMVENGDIQKGPGAGPGQYSGVTLDNNDGLVIIESNDYNQPGENWVIVGAQIAGSDEGVTGTAINLNSAIGAAGDSDVDNNGSLDTDALGFQSDTNDGPFKISSIGFLTTQTTPQNAHLDFNVTVTDGDGDSITQAIAVDVTQAVDSSTPIALGSGVTTINSALPPEPVGTESSSNFSFSNDNGKVNGHGNDKQIGNTGIVAGALAAAGMMAMPAAAAEPMDVDYRQYDPLALSANGFSQQMVDRVAADDLVGSSLGLGNELREQAFDVNGLGSSSHGFEGFGGSGLSLTDVPQGNVDQDLGRALAIDHGPSFDFSTFAAFAPAINMPAAEQLAAAGLGGDAIQRGGSVEQVLADALGAGAAATVDALLQGLPGQEVGGNAGFDSLAIPVADLVPGWDMGLAGGFNPGADMMFRMDAAMFHHDAVTPVVNG